MKKNYFLIFLCCILCVAGIVTGTNLGERFRIYTLTQIIFITLTFITQLRGSKVHYFTLNFLYFCFVIVMYLVFYNHNLVPYFWLFSISFVLGTQSLNESTMKSIGMIYGAASIVILLAAKYTGVFDGWDGNMVSMIAFYGFILFIVTQSSIRSTWDKIVLVMYSVIYFVLLLNEKLNSRSVIIASVVLMLVVFSILPIERFLKYKTIKWVVLFPLLVALLVVCIKDTAIVQKMNILSIAYTRKPIFNGRDTIWWNGIQTLLRSPILGHGTFALANWHNSAIAVLTGLGIVGYLVWINVFHKILKIACFWMSDPLVKGLATAVVIVWIQQSVEMGIVGNNNVNVGLYCIMGLLLARINALEWEEYYNSEREEL